jgi:glutamate-1-semialdehyde 2,1-aminomutase
MGCIFFKKGKVDNFSDALHCDTEKFALYFNKMLESVIYLAPSQYEAMFISAAHSEEDVDITLSALKNTLQAGI